MVMNSILSNYLNVYYTDVLKISAIWGGLFLSLFPIVAKVLDMLTFILMGVIVDRTHSRQGKARPWILFAFPLMLLEFFFTRDRVAKCSEAEGAEIKDAVKEKPSLGHQLRCCMKSRAWVILMVCLIVINLVNSLFGTATFYYCNWVLGSYNDGHTQVLFYALGQAPLGIGVLTRFFPKEK